MTLPEINRIQAPEHWIDTFARTFMPQLFPIPARPEDHLKNHRAQVRVLLDVVWAEAFHAGATWALERQPARMVIEGRLPDWLKMKENNHAESNQDPAGSSGDPVA